MTRSPVSATLIPLVPLAALGWPLAKVIHHEVYVAPEIEEPTSGPLINGELYIHSAHPFEKIDITVDETSWTFGPDDEVKSITIPRTDKITLTATVVWPEGTPESAIRFTLEPAGRSGKEHTLWGYRGLFEEVSEQITFIWDSEK